MQGEICSIHAGKGFGFVRMPYSKDHFFHASDLAAGVVFEALMKGQSVEFDVVSEQRGQRCVNLRPAKRKSKIK